MTANKYYVVWKGFAPGVYDTWEEAEIQVSGFPEASYRAFKTQEAAVEAFREGFDRQGLVQEISKKVKELQEEGVKIEWNPNKPQTSQQQPPTPQPAPATPSAQPPLSPTGKPLIPLGTRDVKVTTDPSPAKTYMQDALAVDAACSGNPGPMEYRGVFVRTGQQVFKIGPLEGGTNNIGEFLAIVHGLALQEQRGTRFPIYSDSVNAQIWVRQGFCKTKLEENETNAPIFDMIRRAETWLRTHSFRVPIIKWETKLWGEIPADFGRK